MTPPSIGRMPDETVAVIGLGLIGGSIARDLAAKGVRVIAYDRDGSAVRSAQEAHVVSDAVDADLHQAANADVIIVATPVDEAHAVLRTIAALGSRARLLFDVGSTKSGIVATALGHGLGARFVGAHPLAGDHRSGWLASRAGLFSGAKVFVCPTPESTPDSVAAVVRLWETLGATTECVDARTHDARLAWLSHLPQVISSALGLALAEAGIQRSELGSGGRDITRLVGSSADMWTPILRENAGALEEALTAVEAEIRTLRELIQAPSGEELARRLRAARAWFEVTGNHEAAVQSADGSARTFD